MKFRNLIFLMLMSNAHVAFGADVDSELSQSSSLVTFDEILDSIEEPVPERMTTGLIESIDLSARTATIGGFFYHFGPSTDSNPLKVKLLGRDFGSLEMLSVDMGVEVTYFQSAAGDRIGNLLVQVESVEAH